MSNAVASVLVTTFTKSTRGVPVLASCTVRAYPACITYTPPPHGSENNVNTALLARIDCSRYLFSSNGAIYHHPSRAEWDCAPLKARWGYTTTFPAAGQKGLVSFEEA
jgi:hypothetical protein